MISRNELKVLIPYSFHVYEQKKMLSLFLTKLSSLKIKNRIYIGMGKHTFF